MVHGLHHQLEAVRPVITVAGEQADAYRVTPGHHPVAVVLDLVNPAGSRRGLVGGRWETQFNEASGGRIG